MGFFCLGERFCLGGNGRFCIIIRLNPRKQRHYRQLIKKIAGYHQFHAVNGAVAETVIVVDDGCSDDTEALLHAPNVLEFRISPTGD